MNLDKQETNNIIHKLVHDIELMDNRQRELNRDRPVTNAYRISDLEAKVEILVNTIVKLERLLNK